MRVRCFQQLERQTEGKVLNCTLLSFELAFLREAFTPGLFVCLFPLNSVINLDQGITVCQTWNLPLQIDYKLTLSDRQPSHNSHSSMDRNLGQHSNYILFLFFSLPFLKAHGTQFLGIPPYGDSLGSTSRTLAVLKTLHFLYSEVYKGTRFNSKGCRLRKNNVLGL